jgi:ribosomal protein S18 acetylase RimI-like enzyme
MTVQIRNFNNKDLSVLVRMLNEAERESYEFTPYTEEDIRSRIQERGMKLLIAEEKDKILGFAAYNDGHWGEEIRWLVVPENRNRKDIENKLVKEAEKCVKGQSVFTAVDAGSPKIDEWTERGYKPEGGLYHMIARLDGLKTLPKVPEGTIIRSLKQNEEEKFVEAVNIGFDGERVQLGIIQRWKSESPSFSEDWVHLAEIDNKIVSVVVAKPDTEYNQFFGGKRGYLGPAATLPEYRGKNLASTLTCRAMNFLYEKGMNSVAVYTSEQNIPSVTLLQNLGFEVAHHWKFMRKTLSQQ